MINCNAWTEHVSPQNVRFYTQEKDSPYHIKKLSRIAKTFDKVLIRVRAETGYSMPRVYLFANASRVPSYFNQTMLHYSFTNHHVMFNLKEAESLHPDHPLGKFKGIKRIVAAFRHELQHYIQECDGRFAESADYNGLVWVANGDYMSLHENVYALKRTYASHISLLDLKLCAGIKDNDTLPVMQIMAGASRVSPKKIAKIIEDVAYMKMQQKYFSLPWEKDANNAAIKFVEKYYV